MIRPSIESRLLKLEKLLKYEAKSVGTLYHVCTPEAYLKYIKPKDQLKASGNYDNYLYGGNDYVSFTRNRNYILNTSLNLDSPILLRLVIDGDKLSDNYSIKPYNDLAFDDESSDNPENREQEEVVKGPIKNISKYIKEIQFDFPYLDEYSIDEIKSLAKKLKSSNVIYTKFIRDTSPQRKRLLSNIHDGDSIDSVIPKLREAINNDPEANLFSGDINKVKSAINNGIDLNRQYEQGYPISYYSIDKYLDILKLLIDSGADVNIADTLPLKRAIQSDSLQAFNFLLENGANPNAKDRRGVSMLATAVGSYGKHEKDFVTALLNAGADVNSEDNDKQTPIFYCHDPKVAKILIDAGADIRHKDATGKTPFAYNTCADTLYKVL